MGSSNDPGSFYDSDFAAAFLPRQFLFPLFAGRKWPFGMENMPGIPQIKTGLRAERLIPCHLKNREAFSAGHVLKNDPHSGNADTNGGRT